MSKSGAMFLEMDEAVDNFFGGAFFKTEEDPEEHTRFTAYSSLKAVMGDREFKCIFGDSYETFNKWVDNHQDG